MVAPHLRVQFVEGDHSNCITTRVDSLGTELRNLLREAQDRAHTTPASAEPAAPIRADSGRSTHGPDDAPVVVSISDKAKSVVSIAPWLLSALANCLEMLSA
jgi:hypothetical protein